MLTISEVLLNGVSQNLFSDDASAGLMKGGIEPVLRAAKPNEPPDVVVRSRSVFGLTEDANGVITRLNPGPEVLTDWLANVDRSEIPEGMENAPNPLAPSTLLFDAAQRQMIVAMREIKRLTPAAQQALNTLYGVPLP